MKSCGPLRTNWKTLVVVVISAQMFACALFRLSHPEDQASDEILVHQMFQQAADSANAVHIKEALARAKDNVLRDLRREKIISGYNEGFILPQEKRFILILSFWRSGSTFLYDLITSFPGTYGYFEPLAIILGDQFDPLQQRNSSLRAKIKSFVKDCFLCNIEDGKEKYFKFLANGFLNLDNRVHEVCTTSSPDVNSSCYDSGLHKAMCQSMPIVVQKLVRLESSFIPELLQSEDQNFKIVVLMRDPRAMMMSRRTVEFCRKSARCSDATLTCAEMERTLDRVTEHQMAYPNRLYFLRYEDLVSNLKRVTQDLFTFLELPVTDSVSRFLQSHTKLLSTQAEKLSHNAYSTYRNSAKMLSQWRKANSFQTVELVQHKCENVLKKLRYKMFVNAVDYKNTSIMNVL